MSDKKPLTDGLGNPLEFGDPEFNPDPGKNNSPEFNQWFEEYMRGILGDPPAKPEPTADAFEESKHPRSHGQFVPGEKAKPRSAEEHLAQSNWHEQEASRRELAATAHAQRGRHGVAGSERDKAELHRVSAEHHLNMSEAKGS